MVNRRACPDLDAAQVLNCGKLALLGPSLSEVRDRSDVCVVSCLTNFLTDAEPSGPTSASLRIEPVLQEVHQLITEACLANPDRLYLLHPPMYRTSPLWYRDGLPEILNKFSFVFSSDKPRNCLLMSGFATPEFDSDGVHLTPTSGLEYIYHLFDASALAISRMSLSPTEAASQSSEASRVLEDRVMALEQDHRRLNKSFELTTAVSAERDDFQENVRNEVFFMISGLPLIKDLRGKDWMAKATSDVQEVIRLLLGKELNIVVVHNASGRKDTTARYSVRMEYAADSQEIRAKFGGFFVGGQDRRPENLKHVSISNKVTPGTQIRLMILKLLAKRYQSANPEGKAKVVGYEARPMIKLTCPETSTQRRVKSYNYTEAISKLPTCFTNAELRPIVSKARIHYRGALRSTFGVLSDDFSSATEVTEAVVQVLDEDEGSAPADTAPAPASGQGSRKRALPEAVNSGPGSQRARR